MRFFLINLYFECSAPDEVEAIETHRRITGGHCLDIQELTPERVTLASGQYYALHSRPKGE